MIRITYAEGIDISAALVKKCEDVGEKILHDFGKHDREIDVYFTDDIEIHRINKEYRGKDTATDVLSFRLADPFDAVEGEILISVETAERQRAHMSLETMCTVLFIHGMLHILGYDHETDEEYEEMYREELKYLPYA